MAARLLASRAFAGASDRRSMLRVRHARRVSADALGGARRRRPRSTRPTRTSTSTAATSSCCRRRRSTWRAHANGARRSLLGPLAGNPFPDATPAFFAAMARALSLGLGDADRDRGAVRGAAQGGRRSGRAIELGVPLELTLSCMQPTDGGALRRVQQVPGTTGCVSRGGGHDPTHVPHTNRCS